MERESTKSVVEKIAQPVIEKHRFEMVDVEVVKEGPHRYIRVFIDKPGGITIDDCQLVSETLDGLLDKADVFMPGDFLEVSSPGERPFKAERDYLRYKGEFVEVKLYQAVDGQKLFEGKLSGLENGKVVIDDASAGRTEFDMAKVATVRRIIKI